jgi:hypothetical protein
VRGVGEVGWDLVDRDLVWPGSGAPEARVIICCRAVGLGMQRVAVARASWLRGRQMVDAVALHGRGYGPLCCRLGSCRAV